VGLFLGRETRAWIPEPPIPPFPGAAMDGTVSVSSKPDAALTIGTVWACVSLLAGSVSSLPLETFRKSNDPSGCTWRWCQCCSAATCTG
jgi:hypothetical protein